MDFNGPQPFQGPNVRFRDSPVRTWFELVHQNEQIFFRVIWLIQKTK